MPLQFQNVPLPLGGMDQKAGRLTRRAGTLDEAINVVVRKAGDQVRLDKARGYQRVNPAECVDVFDPDAVFIGCATLDDELVVFSYDYVLGLGDRGNALRGDDALVYRGPVNRVSCAAYHVGSSQLSQQYDEEEPE